MAQTKTKTTEEADADLIGVLHDGPDVPDEAPPSARPAIPENETELQRIEREHGFTFGDGPDPTGKVLRHVKCETAGCDRADRNAPPVPVHADTVQPIHCGGCGQVLLCDHQPGDPEEVVGGTASAPTLTKTTRCTLCHSVVEQNTTNLQPQKIEDLPAAALHALGVQFKKG